MKNHVQGFQSKFAIIILLLSSISQFAYAHDYWFSPEQFYVEKGLKFRTKMLFGGNLQSEGPRPLRHDITRKLELHTYGEAPVDLLKSQSTKNVKGYTEISVVKPGSYWLITERAPTYIELEAKKFEKYLTGENLHGVVKQRRKNNESKKLGRESYSRSVKTYVSVGAHKDDQTWKMRIPQRIEINPKVDPSTIMKGQKTSLEVLFDSKPLAGVSVNAMRTLRNGKAEVLTSKTDGNGIVSFQLNEPGAWLIRLIHMRRCTKCEKADWESFWGSLALGVRSTKLNKKL